MVTKALFLDRDGVININHGYVCTIEDFDFIDGTFETCKQLQAYGYQLIIITNQSGISRGYYSEKDFKSLTKWMLENFSKQGVNILDVFFCPHGPNSSCECRKPKPGMFLTAQKSYNIDMKNSWMVGDKEEDLIAAKKAGIDNTVLVRSGHPIDEQTSHAEYILKSIKDIIEVIKS